ncbi:SusC/RagA family TonB-linked outer membrane protein [Bacteroides sp.]|uniref:SusC/RagA family TonB-linked outer membrane protein n=1 Tax=Bacteroides sp. TaxID=29523 RepID=UPI002FC6799F
MKQNLFTNFRKPSIILLVLLLSSAASQAQIKITGTITDEAKEVLIGANIKVKDGAAGTITDLYGKYSIEVPNKRSVIVVSFIGYATTEITVSDKKVIDVALKEDGVLLNEVVAIGYANVKKGDLTGAVGKVDMDELNKISALSFDQALGGRVAGVQVVSGDGQPGSSSSIVIRGSNTISDSADGSPLYVIDGFATDDPNAAAYNPNDIESMDILKDASATAIYGARGANGVIIINTKRGKESAPQITYNGFVSWQSRPRYLEVMNGKQFVTLQKELMTQDELDQTYFGYSEQLGRNRTLDDYENIPYNNWQEKVFRTAPLTSHQLSLSGGSRNTRYSSSISYYNQQGVIIKSSYQSLKARVTLDQNISKKLKFGATVNFANNTSNGSAPSQSGGGTAQYFLYQVLAYRPFVPTEKDNLFEEVIDVTGTYPYHPLETIQNIYDRNNTRQLNLNTYLNWDIRKDLSFRATFAYSWQRNSRQAFYNSNTYQGDSRYSANGVNGSFTDREADGWSNEYTLTYKKRVAKHNFTGLIGSSLNSQQITVQGAQSILDPFEELGYWGIDNGTPRNITTTNIENKLLSFFTRLNYDWSSRYLFTATVRADGSSRFPYNKWGYFPSLSFAWRLSDEPFLNLKNTFISNLKLRAGWGATGNNNTQNNYPSLRLYATDQNYAFNNTLLPAVYISQIANKSLKWETTYQTNIGLDFGLFKNRINGEIEVYSKNTKDLLLFAEVPGSFGFTSVQQNIGSVNNRGLEISINTVNIQGENGRFKWTTNFNISFNKNKVTGLTGDQDSRFASVVAPNNYIGKVGRPLSEMYGYVYDGVYQYEDFDEIAPNTFVLKPLIPNNTQERTNIKPGDVKLKDLNGDGQVTAEDQIIIGHGLPIHTGGFTNNFEWKGFDLNIFFQWSYGNDVINYNRTRLETMRGKNFNQLASVVNHWTPRIDNGDGTYTPGNYTNYLPAANRSLSINTDREIEDASFLRLKNLQIGYNFQPKLLRNMKMRSLRIYLSGENLITFTRYTGYDPEVSTRNSAMTRGFDYSSYPRTVSYTFGVKVGF